MIGSATGAGLAFSFTLPTRIRFGRGVRTSVGAVAAAAGPRTVLVTGGSFDRNAAAADVLTALAEAGVEVVDRVVVGGEPDDLGVLELVRRLDAADVASIVAVGGGSVLDLAKAAALRPSRERLDALLGGERVESGGLPVIALPTTAGSGAEVSHAAIVFHRASGRKRGVRGPGVAAREAIVDPDLMVGAPPAVIAGSGFDAIAHAVETSASRAASELVIHLAGTALPRLLDVGAERLPLARRRRGPDRGRLRRDADGREPRELDDMPPAPAAVPGRGTDRDAATRWASRPSSRHGWNGPGPSPPRPSPGSRESAGLSARTPRPMPPPRRSRPASSATSTRLACASACATSAWRPTDLDGLVEAVEGTLANDPGPTETGGPAGALRASL